MEILSIKELEISNSHPILKGVMKEIKEQMETQGWGGGDWSGGQWNGAQWGGGQWDGGQWNGAQWGGGQYSGD